MKAIRWLDVLRRSRLRELVGGLLVGAFLLSALVPPGYMPSADGPGLMELCSGKTMRAAPLPADGTLTGEAPADEPPHSDPPCPFAALVAWTAPPTLVLDLGASAQTALRLPLGPVTALRSRDGPPRAHAPRGPPALI